MKLGHFTFFCATVLGSIGCGIEDPIEQSTPTPKWSFSVSNGELRLVDSDQQSAARLRSQIVEMYSLVQKFQEPIVWKRTSSFFSGQWKSQLRVHKYDGNAVEASWVQSTRSLSSHAFGRCKDRYSISSSASPCEALTLLSCLDSQTRETWSSNRSLNSGSSRSVLINALKECGVSLQLVGRSSPEYTFSMSNGSAEFSPFPVFSLLLFEGLWSSYEDANAQSSARASFSDPSCTRADAACLNSPLSMSFCQGCDLLKKGQLYTVFFLENLRQNYDVVQSAPYVH
jgi:hypothetical protein